MDWVRCTPLMLGSDSLQYPAENKPLCTRVVPFNFGQVLHSSPPHAEGEWVKNNICTECPGRQLNSLARVGQDLVRCRHVTCQLLARHVRNTAALAVGNVSFFEVHSPPRTVAAHLPLPGFGVSSSLSSSLALRFMVRSLLLRASALRMFTSTLWYSSAHMLSIISNLQQWDKRMCWEVNECFNDSPSQP